MRAGTRLALYGVGLALAFGGAFGLAGATVPEDFVAAWAEGGGVDAHSDDHGKAGQRLAGQTLNGLSLDADGFVLSPVLAPRTTAVDGELSFQILSETGEPVTEFTTAHEKDLHLIVVRTDGSHFRHVHPALDAGTGTWSIPWAWQEAGSYRVYVDFTAAADGASGVTLTRTVEVAGRVDPVEKAPRQVDEVDGFTVSLDGGLVAGSSSELTISISHDGAPVTTLQPYLGAFGHLVALREGDLAYLHVHAEGDEPRIGEVSGPRIAFAAEAPTAGRYLLYLDFQVDGEVRTAEFVLDAELADRAGTDGDGHDDGHSGEH